MPSPSTSPRVYLIGNASKARVPPAFSRLRDVLSARGMLIGADLDGRPETVNGKTPDFVMVLGGDGTILSAAQAMQHQQVPIIGVNLGKLGYLAAFSLEEIEERLDRLVSDASLISRRMMLDVRVTHADRPPWSGIAVNDCVFRVGSPFRTVRFELHVNGKNISTIVSDGLVLSTPTGSTAHNMSCGGPIVDPEVNAIIVTPMNPHSLTHRPIVVGGDAEIAICANRTNDGTAAVLDGQTEQPIHGGTRVEVRRADEPFQLVCHPDRPSWNTLIQKLGWGRHLT